jgi:hypothetical protein
LSGPKKASQSYLWGCDYFEGKIFVWPKQIYNASMPVKNEGI